MAENESEKDLLPEEEYSSMQYENFVVNVRQYKTLLTKKYLKRKPYKLKDPDVVTAFIPGIIQKISVKKGKEVRKGRKLMVLEAMKMNNLILAPRTGKIKKISVKEGDMVTKDQVLVEFEKLEEEE